MPQVTLLHFFGNSHPENIYGTTGWDGVLKRVMETLSDAISQAMIQCYHDRQQG